VAATWQAVGSGDFLFMSGGGIMGHPDGPEAGVASIRQAAAAAQAGRSVTEQAKTHEELEHALAFFGRS
jgi:ribulose-bisphosphate carboxylase large chain